MAINSSSFVCIHGFVVLVILSGMLRHMDYVSGQCQGDMSQLAVQCKPYIQKEGPRISPSVACCNVVKNVDVPCVCSHITKGVEEAISMEKAVFVAGFCGKPLPHGSKCGSYTVPSSLGVLGG